MRDKQKTREGVLGFTGSKTGHGEKIRWESVAVCSLPCKEMCPLSLLSGPGYGLQSCPVSVLQTVPLCGLLSPPAGQ